MTYQCDALPLFCLVGREHAACKRLNSEDGKKVGRDSGSGDSLVSICSSQREGNAVVNSHILEAVTLTPRVHVPVSGSALTKVLTGLLGPQHSEPLAGPE